jgi:hypothetical protein
MFKNRFLLMLGIISLVLVSFAISSFRASDALSKREAAWNLAARRSHDPAAASAYLDAIMKRQAAWDYAERRTDAAAPAGAYSAAIMKRQAVWDYAERRTDAAAPAGVYSGAEVDLTDYYFRHLSQ